MFAIQEIGSKNGTCIPLCFGSGDSALDCSITPPTRHVGTDQALANGFNQLILKQAAFDRISSGGYGVNRAFQPVTRWPDWVLCAMKPWTLARQHARIFGPCSWLFLIPMACRSITTNNESDKFVVRISTFSGMAVGILKRWADCLNAIRFLVWW